MINSAQHLLAVDQLLGTVITTTGTVSLSGATGGNYYDRGPLHSGNDVAAGLGSGLGDGNMMYFWWKISVSLAQASGDITLNVVSDETTTFDGNSSVHATTGAITVASGAFAAGKMGFLPLAPRSLNGLTGWRRYVGLIAVVTAADVTAGTLTAGLCRSIEDLAQFASGLNWGTSAT